MSEFASIVLVDAGGRLLLQERDEHPEIDPDLWSLVGGHVEPGESVDDAAYRELAEETGLALPRGALERWRTFTTTRVAPDGAPRHDAMHVHLGSTLATDADIVCGEGRQIVFVEPREALLLALSPFAAEVLPALLSSPVYADHRSRHGWS